MLDMFSRPGDPDTHDYLYATPAATLLVGCIAGFAAGLPEVTTMTYLISAASCIAAVACLSQITTARVCCLVVSAESRVYDQQ